MIRFLAKLALAVLVPLVVAVPLLILWKADGDHPAHNFVGQPTLLVLVALGAAVVFGVRWVLRSEGELD